ncbi:MAG: transglycosylase SLT domain-containing protein [Deltaproteobacteria bacterium]|jgi:membrane-bound lytic murein transglycosylase D|nr:transglycosylase SLT domain-containing protein [Deltaproteobacteria bacterium]
MMKLFFKYFKLLYIFPVALAAVLIPIEIAAESDPFPQYGCIQPNVDFWKKIYSEYTSSQGVLHDNRRLDIIYGVIELKNPDLPGGRKINRKRIKTAKQKYKAILAKLMRGEPPSGKLEKDIAAQFGPHAKAVDYRKALYNIRCQTGQKDRFRAGVIRSGAYIEKMQEIFRNAGLPEDLAYMPHVESSFNPKAYSKFGAAGVWQFTRSTGRQYMAVGYTIDERRDPIISTYAAAKLLQTNYRKLQNWPMAITAYNHGATGMLRAKRKKGSYEAIFKSYRSRLFKFASRNFYSEFLAAREVARNYRVYFGELKLDEPIDTTEVTLEGYASLPEIARYLDINPADLSELNPALRGPVVRGQKYVPRGYRLKLPADTGRDWQAEMAGLSDKLFKKYQKRSRIYTVQRGDTAGEIARIHGVRLRDLIAANNLDARATIYVNQNLRIPLSEKEAIQIAKLEKQKKSKSNSVNSASPSRVEGRALNAPTVDMWLAMNSDTADQRAETETAAVSPVIRSIEAKTEVKSPTLVAAIDDNLGHQQKSAELSPPPSLPQIKNEEPQPALLAGIELFYRQEGKIPTVFAGTPVESDQLKEAALFLADLEPEYVLENKVGELSTAKSAKNEPGPGTDVAQPALNLPVSNPQILQADLAISRIWKHQGRSIGTIHVEVEETLGHYAEWLNVTAWEIRRLNGFSYARKIHLDQQIKIPLHRATREEFEEQRYEYHKEMTEDFFASYRVEKVEVYSIKRGDNIWTLSRDEFDVPLWLIRRFNSDIDFNALVPQQKLKIPIIQKLT